MLSSRLPVRPLTVVALVGVLLLTAGCGSMMNMANKRQVYGGVALDMIYMDTPPEGGEGTGWFFAWDLPLTFVMDTFSAPMMGLVQLIRWATGAPELELPEPPPTINGPINPPPPAPAVPAPADTAPKAGPAPKADPAPAKR